MYMERKDKFRDPKIKKKTLWSEMARVMNLAGYNVDEDILDRKIRNMKKTYKSIKDNNSKNSTGRGRVTWEYFDAFEEIFASDRTVNCGPVLSSMAISDVDVSLKSSALSSTTSCIPSSPLSPDENEPPQKLQKTVAAKSMSSLHHMGKKILEVEERKAAASEDLNGVLRETNKLLQDRNELLRRF
ncbi:PREDICTED: uncharacterized protein LOC108360900 [Rhagoletis zephyria]|uniref:uncharacterized protein LOC108360900 n=1 Tax=Rhagoletis zephyria TaxID=28612 RepID=UPI000811A495|nr:PREDICTED: uncharacterized protein LOC108360900 [Rhagoletis zephyria]